MTKIAADNNNAATPSAQSGLQSPTTPSAPISGSPTYSERLGLVHAVNVKEATSRGVGFLEFTGGVDSRAAGTLTSAVAVEMAPMPAPVKSVTLPPEAPTSTNPTSSGEDPNGSLRWKVLLLLCLMLFGTDYCYDLPGSIGAGEGITVQSHFTDAGSTYNQKMNQALYSVYSYPNLIMTVVGGILIDKYLGLRKTSILMGSMVVAGSIVFTFGIHLVSYPVMVLGRFTFGLSGEVLFVAQGSFLSRWFGQSPYLSFAFGIAISASRLGGGMSYMISPTVARWGGVVASAFAGSFFASLSLLGCIGVVLIDGACERKGTIAQSAAAKHKAAMRRNKMIKASRSMDNLNSPSCPASPVTPAATSGGADGKDLPATAEEQTTVTFKLSLIPSLPPTLWFLALSGMLCYGTTFPFVGIAKTMFERLYSLDADTASFSAGLFHIFGAILCPLMGRVVDKYGRSPYWLMASTSGLIAVFSTFMLVPSLINPIIGVGCLSVFYSFFVGALWSFAPHTVPSSASGFAFGVMSCFVNLGFATTPLFTGSILDSHTDASAVAGADGDLLPTAEGFRYTMMFLTGVVTVAFVNACVLWRTDMRNGVILMADPSVRAARKEARDEALMAEWRALEEAEEAKKTSGANAV